MLITHELVENMIELVRVSDRMMKFKIVFENSCTRYYLLMHYKCKDQRKKNVRFGRDWKRSCWDSRVRGNRYCRRHEHELVVVGDVVVGDILVVVARVMKM